MRAADKVRLDQLVVDRGLAQTRARAQALIMAGKVIVDEKRIDKPGQKVPLVSQLRLKDSDHPYVSRGGVKLEHALRELHVDAGGKRCLDLGASTGGFSDCLLQHGARQVIAVDVGYGQLHPKLRDDPRVVVMERTNARHLDLPNIGGAPADLAVIDCSFISLELILPAAARCLAADGELIALVKPQFEVGKGQVGKGGVVRDDSLRTAAVEKVRQAAVAEGFEVRGVIPSPVLGPAGNVEYLLLGVKKPIPGDQF